jgi:hypothetical protein
MTSQPTESQFNRRNTKTVKAPKTHIEKLNKPNHLEELHCGDFSVDHNVQRALNEARRDEMAADFRPDSLGLVTASLRADGRLYLLDGQTRVAAARVAHYDGLIATRVFEGLTLKEEAGLFLTLNKMRTVSTIEKFKVRVTLGDTVAVNINKILKAYGLNVNFAAASKPNTISAVVTLEKVYHGAGVRDGGHHADLVDRVIGSLIKAYGGDTRPVVFSRALVEGMGIFHATYGKKIDRDRLTDTMSAVPPRQVASRARTRRDALGGSLGENAAEVILDIYNSRRKDKLPPFGKTDPVGNYADPTKDELYVDPQQYISASTEPSLQPA